jgi:DNA-binding response OmpR family regulator
MTDLKPVKSDKGPPANPARQKFSESDLPIWYRFYRLHYAPRRSALPPLERTLLNLLAKRPVVSREAAFNILYSNRQRQPANLRIIDTIVKRLRRMLKPHGIRIVTERSIGYKIDPESRARLVSFLATNQLH